jgi:hypothetical protein
MPGLSLHRYLSLLGIGLMIVSILSFGLTASAEAQQLQTTPTAPLPPRPTLTATATETPTATQTNTPTPTNAPSATATATPVATTPVEEEEEDRPTAVVPGRITGTVIDRRSGAPASGISVQIGDDIVVSDSNGNYDRNGIVPGSYTVALVLGEGQGEAAQGPLELTVRAGETVVQHLAFFGPLAQETATAEPSPTIAATTPATTATVLATATVPAAPQPTPVPVPSELPATGGDNIFAPALMLVGLLCFVVGIMLRTRQSL